LTGFTLLACSIGVLIFSLRTNRIGTNHHYNKPQLLIFIILGVIASVAILSGFTLLACSIGVLIFSLRTNRIGTNHHYNKPQLLIFIILGVIASVAILLGNIVI
jgi:uncharacterized membrane protein